MQNGDDIDEVTGLKVKDRMFFHRKGVISRSDFRPVPPKILMLDEPSLRLSDRGYVLEHGRIAVEGKAQELLGDPHIKEAYLGI